MSDGKGQRKWPIPEGFVWSHNSDVYTHSDGRTWDPNTNAMTGPKGELLTEVNHVSSTSDARTVNNDNNVMRHNYRVLSEDEKAFMMYVKDLGLQFHEVLEGRGQSRELSLAKTKIEEAVMWAVKHITK